MTQTVAREAAIARMLTKKLPCFIRDPPCSRAGARRSLQQSPSHERNAFRTDGPGLAQSREEAFMNERTDYLTWIVFFVAGGLAGAGGALLFAPHSGRDTRGRMGRRLSRAGRAARDLGERALRRGEELGDEAAGRVEEVHSS
jgi:hypothetical protein